MLDKTQSVLDETLPINEIDDIKKLEELNEVLQKDRKR